MTPVRPDIEKTPQSTVLQLIRDTKLASIRLAKATSEQKDLLLREISVQIKKDKDKILEANSKDISNISSKDYSSSFLDRLKLDEGRVIDIVKRYYEISERECISCLELLYGTLEGKMQLKTILEMYGSENKKIKKLKLEK